MNTTDTAVDTTRADTTTPVSAPASDTATTRHDTPKWPRRWPLAMLAAPAGVATWSGWVGLGGLTGFGEVHPLPGIADSFTLNSAITLPIGVEAYAAYAMAAWLTNAPVSAETRKFARSSAVGALVLGMLGQVAYHLLAAGHSKHAPWWITTMVACLPVLVLGAGASLTHMLHRDKASVSNTVPETTPDTDTAVSDTPATRVENTARPVSSTTTDTAPGTVPARVENTGSDTIADTVPSVPDTAQNTAPDTTRHDTDTASSDTDDPNEYVRKMAEQERARKREEDRKSRQRPPARRAVKTEQPDRDTVARRIYDEYVAEHDEAPAVAELMRRLKAAGYPTGNRTAAALLNEMREHPLRIAN